MKRLTLCVVVMAIALAIPQAGFAQEEAPKPFVYAIYYTCDTERQELADEIVDLIYAPAYNAAVDAGEIQSWGWLTHHTGSEWRRVMYHSAPDMGTLLSALEDTNGAIGEKYPEMSRAFSDVCESHVDYIWQHGTGSRKGELAVDRGKAGFSGYIKCDMSREDRADEIVDGVIGPALDRLVADGKIESWGWMKHVIGGKWRRIEIMTGADHGSLLAARGELISGLMESNREAMTEFAEICGSHQDFLWNIVHEKP